MKCELLSLHHDPGNFISHVNGCMYLSILCTLPDSLYLIALVCAFTIQWRYLIAFCNAIQEQPEKCRDLERSPVNI
jgi:hypothetical protein